MRPALSIHARQRRRAARPAVERWLDVLGAGAGITESVLGDLAEERAERAARDGALRANWWYLCEALRCAPWLALNALRRAGWRGRTEAAAVMATIGLAVTLLVSLALALPGSPQRLAPIGDYGDGIVVNNVKPVRLTVRVSDARGHILPDTAVRYHWRSGMPLPISARGIVACKQRGDAIVRATLGSLGTDLVLHCRPVTTVHGQSVALIVGEGAAPIPFVAMDASGRLVTQLRGAIKVADSTIAGMTPAAGGEKLLLARAAGTTRLEVSIGDHDATVFVDAYRRASTPSAIKPGDQVAMRVRLRSREVREWTLPTSREIYRIRMLPDGDEASMPWLAIAGANCVTWRAHEFECAAPHGATVYAYYPAWGDQAHERSGSLAVARAAYP